MLFGKTDADDVTVAVDVTADVTLDVTEGGISAGMDDVTPVNITVDVTFDVTVDVTAAVTGAVNAHDVSCAGDGIEIGRYPDGGVSFVSFVAKKYFNYIDLVIL